MSFVTYLIAGVVVWIICGVIAYGYAFAYYQRKWPGIANMYYKEDKRDCMWMALFGPIDLLVVLTRGMYRHGMKFR